MESTNKTVGELVSDEALVRDAYERIQGDLAALKPEELIQVNLDIPSAVTTVLGVLPEVRALRERIVKELPTFDLARFDKLEDYALALSFAQTSYLTTTQPPDDLLMLSTEATKVRETLLADVQALVRHGLIDSAQLSRLKGANGYKNIAQDLQILSKLMEEHWAAIQGKSATTVEELQIAYRISARLMRIVGLREQGPALQAAASEKRLRAFTLLVRAYDEARRAVAYLRAREGDADSISPALHPGRPRRRSSEETPSTGGGQAPNAAAGPQAPVLASAMTTPVADPAPILDPEPASKDPLIS